MFVAPFMNLCAILVSDSYYEMLVVFNFSCLSVFFWYQYTGSGGIRVITATNYRSVISGSFYVSQSFQCQGPFLRIKEYPALNNIMRSGSIW
jgi:hypothetical protein